MKGLSKYLICIQCEMCLHLSLKKEEQLYMHLLPNFSTGVRKDCYMKTENKFEQRNLQWSHEIHRNFEISTFHICLVWLLKESVVMENLIFCFHCS